MKLYQSKLFLHFFVAAAQAQKQKFAALPQNKDRKLIQIHFFIILRQSRMYKASCGIAATKQCVHVDTL